MQTHKEFLEKFREANRERYNIRYTDDTTWEMCDWIAAMAGEVGEAINSRKKMERIKANTKGYENNANYDVYYLNYLEELADIFTYLDLLGILTGFGTDTYLAADHLYRDVRAEYHDAKSEMDYLMIVMEETCAIRRLAEMNAWSSVRERAKSIYARIRILFEFNDGDFTEEVKNKFNTVSDRFDCGVYL